MIKRKTKIFQLTVKFGKLQKNISNQETKNQIYRAQNIPFQYIDEWKNREKKNGYSRDSIKNNHKLNFKQKQTETY